MFLSRICIRANPIKTAFRPVQRSHTRSLQTDGSSQGQRPDPSDFAFAFDIDGVLLRSSKPLPHAQRSLAFLQRNSIPFILLTNGGGLHEKDRVAELSRLLEIPLNTNVFIQSHTPFQQLLDGQNDSLPLRDKCVLVLGGEGNNCRKVAENYGFKNVVTSADVITEHPNLMPFVSPSDHASFAQALPRPTHESHHPLKIDAILVFNDPRNWILDIQLIIDLLLSHSGILGTFSSKNGNASLPNRGYQQDNQPSLYFSNPDLLWAAKYHLPRMGQGAFLEALTGVWNAMTGGEKQGVTLQKTMIGKPFQSTYEFAENRLTKHHDALTKSHPSSPSPSRLQRVYMIGDNPESDILGANSYSKHSPSTWHSILVRTGVYTEANGKPAHSPDVIVDHVGEAVHWALRHSRWAGDFKEL